MDYSIRKLSPIDRVQIDEVYELLNSSYDKAISEFFMYRDRNYKSYLAMSLVGEQDAVYGAISDQGELMGFAQVKFLDTRMFLNNLIIKPAFRGYHIASGLLKFIIDDAVKSQSGIQALALDVFEKNRDVLNWYLKLGMEIKSSRYWYDLKNRYCQDRGDSASSSIKIVKDQSGFMQVHAGDSRIGTLINSENLVIRSEIEPVVLTSLKNYFKGELKGLCLITDELLGYPIIDRSFQLQVALADLKLSDKV